MSETVESRLAKLEEKVVNQERVMGLFIKDVLLAMNPLIAHLVMAGGVHHLEVLPKKFMLRVTRAVGMRMAEMEDPECEACINELVDAIEAGQLELVRACMSQLETLLISSAHRREARERSKETTVVVAPSPYNDDDTVN